MPSIIPSYIYTIFASILVGSIIIAAIGVAVVDVKETADAQQVSNLSQYVAIKSLELISQTSSDNANATITLDLPSTISNQQYWITLSNSSSEPWVQAGVGINTASSEHQAFIPRQVYASGVYVSISGQAHLQCCSNSSGIYLKIYGETT
jgi:hypothetical protein